MKWEFNQKESSKSPKLKNFRNFFMQSAEVNKKRTPNGSWQSIYQITLTLTWAKFWRKRIISWIVNIVSCKKIVSNGEIRPEYHSNTKVKNVEISLSRKEWNSVGAISKKYSRNLGISFPSYMAVQGKPSLTTSAVSGKSRFTLNGKIFGEINF